MKKTSNKIPSAFLKKLFSMVTGLGFWVFPSLSCLREILTVTVVSFRLHSCKERGVICQFLQNKYFKEPKQQTKKGWQHCSSPLPLKQGGHHSRKCDLKVSIEVEVALLSSQEFICPSYYVILLIPLLQDQNAVRSPL